MISGLVRHTRIFRIGTASPAGGNFEGPVTQATLATVKDL